MDKVTRESIIYNLVDKIDELEKEHNFLRDGGVIQLFEKGKDTHIAYGRYRAYCDLLEELL